MSTPIDVPSWQYIRANALAALVRTYLTRGLRFGSDLLRPTASEEDYDKGNEAQSIVVPGQATVTVPGGVITAYNAEMLEAMIAGLALEEPWHEFGNAGEAAFGADWENYDAAARTSCAWKREAFGSYVLKGVAKSTVPGFSVPIATLPAALRPRKTMAFATVGNNAFTRVDLESNGALTVIASDSATPEDFVSLDGIRWRTG